MNTQQPNILILFSDQLNARCFSCEDHPDVKTPNLDRLAAGSVRFSNAYCQNPVCTPSRMSFLSSLYPSTHGYYGLYGREPEARCTNMFAYFKECGYRTGALGKLHTPRYWIERECQFVYDEFIEFPKYLEGAGLYEHNDNRRFTETRDGVLRDGSTSLLPLEHSCESALAKQTARFMRNEGEPADRGADDAPWMAWVSFPRPHSPITPSEPFASMYKPDDLTLPPSADLAQCTNKAQWPRTLPHRKEEPTENDLRNMLSKYFGLVSQTDWGVGQVLDELEARGELENTIIVFTTDHGDYAGEFGLWSKTGGIRSRAITRISIFISYPGHVNAGTVCAEMAESIDVFPTLCELAGLPVPDHVQGVSLLPLLGDEPQAVREDALTENAFRKALATKRWRYIANIDEQKDELYDLENDPWELHNLIDDPACAEVAAQLQRRLLYRVASARKPVTHFDGMGWHHDYDRDGRSALKHVYKKPAYV
ncbi:MAG: sulfatase-like hydrolase/transferase [bacterium]|nr:sulfatase-like hydrolase/transferase [bacterium]